MINFKDRQITIEEALSMNKFRLLEGMIESVKIKLEGKMCNGNTENCKHAVICDGCGKHLSRCETDHINCKQYVRRLQIEGHYNLDGGSFCCDCWKEGKQWQWRSAKLKKEREEKDGKG